MGFFNGHNHTHYSNLRLLDCINKPTDLIDRAIQLGLSGIAITDHECISSHMEVNKYAKKIREKYPDFTIALGNEIYLVDERIKGQEYFHFILIAKDAVGHRAIRELSSKAWYNSYMDRAMERVPLLKSELKEIMSKYKGHVIATTACIGGELSKLLIAQHFIEQTRLPMDPTPEEMQEKIDNFIHFCVDIFGDDFFIECAPSDEKDQVLVNKMLMKTAIRHNIRVTAATDSHYLGEETRFAHKAYLNSKDGDREVDDFYKYAKLMDEKEVRELLTHSFDLPVIDDIITNTEYMRQKIEWYSLERPQQIPLVNVPKRTMLGWGLSDRRYPTLWRINTEGNDQEQYWLDSCLEKLKELPLTDEEIDLYLDRLEIEADVIQYIGDRLGTCLYAYFNTFKHYIDLFWKCGSIVGPGRGSATGFLSNYLLGITQLNPIKWNLPWWRFLNKERAELPDIDIDLAPSKRPKIFQEIRKERGELNLIQVATFGTEGTKSAILTACRGYRQQDPDGVEMFPDGIDVDIAQYMSSLIPQERGFLWTIKEVVYGDKEKGRAPVTAFIHEVNRYPGLLDIIFNIDGLIKQRGCHASGVILYNGDICDTGAIMRTPSGDLITCYDLHDAEAAGDTKYDFLVTDACDKIICCIDLLQKDKVIDPSMELRDCYDKYLHPEIINTEDPRIWSALAAGSVLDVFQFNGGVGLAIAKKVRPQNPLEMTAANAMMRLMSEQGKESQQDRYARIKAEGIKVFDTEMRESRLPESMIKAMHKHCDKYYGCCAIQEQMMEILMDPEIASFSLKEANDARKIVAKKQMSRIPELKNKVYDVMDQRLADYVWEVAVAPQLGYAFSINHSLPYSFVAIQEIILSILYNPIYWNTACLIVNSGSLEAESEEPDEEVVDIFEPEDFENYTYEDSPDHTSKVRKKIASTDYSKIAKALGDITSHGIKVILPDINRSSFGFIPDAENNAILFGLKALLNVGDELVDSIIAGRPYTSFADFVVRIHPAKQSVISLIKGGAFDSFGERKDIMAEFIWRTCDKKSKLNLQNMNKLIQAGLIPDRLSHQQAVFEFNRYLKNECVSPAFGKTNYVLDNRAIMFLDKNDYNVGWTDVGGYPIMDAKAWDKVYQAEMDSVREYLKTHQEEVLYQLNKKIFYDDWMKYAKGTYSAWEMEALCYYYHEHELKNVNVARYGISDFSRLPEEPELEGMYRGKIPIYKLHKIIGTCIAKNKTKSTISLLTTSGVVEVKFRKEYFSLFDKQISERGEDGKKHVVEKSWFNRGSMLMITGIRRGDNFMPKKYATTPGHQLYKIDEVQANGSLGLRYERIGGELED